MKKPQRSPRLSVQKTRNSDDDDFSQVGNKVMDKPLALAPQKFREIVFQLIYSDDFGADSDVVGMLMAQLAVTKRVMREACSIKERFLTKKEEIDALITLHAKGYELSRIPRVERNVIRLGIYELLYVPELSGKVAIAEAMRLTRKFATKEAVSFVNALMDSIYQTLQKEPSYEPACVETAP